MANNEYKILSEDAIKYLCGLIRDVSTLPSSLIDDINIQTVTSYSSFKLEQLLATLKQENEEYADALVAGLNKLTKEIITDQSQITNENVLYLLLVDSANSIYQQWLLINGTPTMIGTTEMSLDSVYSKGESDSKFATKTSVEDIVNVIGTDTLSTTATTLKGAINEVKGIAGGKADKSDIPTTLPANGGNSDTVNNHTVKSDVPENAVFTDTVYDDTEVKESINHNIPRLVPKNITSYYTDGTLWDRLNGTNGFSLFEDIFVGDYIKMSRPISAYSQDQTQQLTGSQYVTIAGIDTLWGSGDNTSMVCHHLVMIPGQGFGGTQHFGRSRMNPTDTTEGGYVATEMHTITIGAVATEGSTETTATINQQLYAEFGSHLKTTRELLSNSLNTTGYNRLGANTGCSNNWTWTDCQAVLMSEIEVYGSIVWSSSGYDIGTANKQLPLFVNSKQAINNRTAWYWLKDIASASSFCGCDYGGVSDYNAASFANRCVRPRFVIAK